MFFFWRKLELGGTALERDLMSTSSTNCQVQLAPDPALILAMLVLFPFTFTEHLQSGGVDDQMSDSALAGQAVLYVHGLGAFADTAVTRRGQRYIHQLKNGVDEPFQRP